MPNRSAVSTRQSPRSSLTRSRSNSPKSRRPKTSEDVQPSISLPPSVEGPLRGFLQIEVSKLVLLTPVTVEKPNVRLKWWGERPDSIGTVFRPKVIHNKIEIVTTDSNGLLQPPRTTCLFPIKSGPTQMLSYLRDMSTLQLELYSGQNPIARCNIHQITQLSYQQPITGNFAMFGADSEKVAQVQVALSFKDSVNASAKAEVSKAAELKAPDQSPLIGLPKNYDLTANAYREEKSQNSLAGVPDFSKTQSSLPVEDTRSSVDDLITFLIQRGSTLREALVQNEETSLNNLPAATAVRPAARIESPVQLAAGFDRSDKENVDVIPRDPVADDRDLVRSSLNFHDLVYKFDKKRLEALALKSNIDGSNLNDMTISDDEKLGLKSKKLTAEDSSDSDNPVRDSSIVRRVLNRNGFVSSSITSTGSESSDTDIEIGDKVKKSGKKPKKSKVRNRSVSASSDSSVESDMEILRKQELMLLEELNSDSKADKRFNRPNFTTEGDGLGNYLEDENEDWTLSVDRFNLLQSVNKAMVVIDSFSVATTSSAPGLKLPPKVPFISKHAEYYVEFSFPSCMPQHRIEMRESKVNCRSANPETGNVIFSHRSMFPLCIGTTGKTILRELWGQAVTFHLYLKSSKTLTPRLVGSGAIRLRDVLEADFFSRSISLPLKKYFAYKKKKRRQSKKLDSPHIVGQLKISIELTSDTQSFTSKVNELKVKEASKSKPLMVSLKENFVTNERNNVVVENVTAHVRGEVAPNVRVDREFGADNLSLKETSTGKITGNSKSVTEDSTENDGEAMFFLLTIGQAALEKYVSSKYSNINVYVIARVFFLEDWVRSDICWGSDHNPNFNICFSVPFVLTPNILQRMKNNYVIIEVWNKLTTAGNDELIGLVKIPTSQFHLSFANQRLMSLLREAHYPVVAGDGTFPIVHPSDLNKSVRGKVAVTLAVGSSDQVAALKHIKMASDSVSYANKSVISTSADGLNFFPSKELNEHTFEIMINGLKSFNQFSDDVHGEADCYIQYFFPDQENFNFFPQQNSNNPGPFVLRKFKTSPTLCVPDVLFHDVIHHKLVLPSNLSLPNQLLRVIAADPESQRTLKFEVWTRHYHPNLRDQIVATCQLPLPKLWSLITMHSHAKYQPSCQNFVLPLTGISCVDLDQSFQGIELAKKQIPHCGVLEATVSYKVADFGCASTLKGLGVNTQVVLRMNIIRACGLEEAALTAVKEFPNLEYYSKVGLNSYFKVSLSFADPKEARSTRVVAQSFAPETGSVMEIPLSVYFKGEKTSHVVSLAERLENEFCVVELWHQQSPSKAEDVFHVSDKKKEYLIASCSVPLRDLLYLNSGIRGWQPLHPVDGEGIRNDCVNVGGVDVQLAFVRSEDKEKVIQAGRGCGWKEQYDSISPLASAQKYRITICLSDFSCSRRDFSSMLLNHVNGQSRRSMKCYIRYKFYDKPAVCTHSISLRHLGENSFVGKFDYRESISIEMSEPLKYYLKEEPLELQLWSAGDVTAPKGHRRDKYLGSAYLTLTSLTRSVNVCTVSENCAIYKPGASYIGVTQIRASVTLEQSSTSGDVRNYDGDEVELNSDSNSDDEDKEEKVDLSNTFKAHVEIERAYHLDLYSSSISSEINTAKVTADTSELYFTFQMVQDSKPVTSTAAKFQTSPSWNFQTETYLSYDYLKTSNPLILKLWLHMIEQKQSSSSSILDKVFGFVAVDLSPLNAGFSQVNGYYNVTNFSNQVLGQVKLSIIPMDGFKQQTVCKADRDVRSLQKTTEPVVESRECPAEKEVSFLRRSVDTSFHCGVGGYPIGGTSSTMEELKRHLEELEAVKESLRKKATKQLKHADVLLNPGLYSSREVSMANKDLDVDQAAVQPNSASYGSGDVLEALASLEPTEPLVRSGSELRYGSGGHGDRPQTHLVRTSTEDNAQKLLEAINVTKDDLICFDREAKNDDRRGVESAVNTHDDTLSDAHLDDNESEAFSDGETEDVTRSRDLERSSFPRDERDEQRPSNQNELYQSFGSKSSTEDVFIGNEADRAMDNSEAHSNEEGDGIPNIAIPSGESATYTLDKTTPETHLSGNHQPKNGTGESNRMTEISYETIMDEVGKASEMTTFRQLEEEFNDEELLPFDSPQSPLEPVAPDLGNRDEQDGDNRNFPDQDVNESGVPLEVEETSGVADVADVPEVVDVDNGEETEIDDHHETADEPLGYMGTNVGSVFSPMSSVDVTEHANPIMDVPVSTERNEAVVERLHDEVVLEPNPTVNINQNLDLGDQDFNSGTAENLVDNSTHKMESPREIDTERSHHSISDNSNAGFDERAQLINAENEHDLNVNERAEMVTSQNGERNQNRIVPEVTVPQGMTFSSSISSSNGTSPTVTLASRPQTAKMPSVEEAKRIARIFSTKYS